MPEDSEHLPLDKRVPTAEEKVSELLDSLHGLGPFDLDDRIQGIRAQAMREKWYISGQILTRDQVMGVILYLMELGNLPPTITRIPGFPAMTTILKWCDEYPDTFGEPFKLAERAQAYQLVEDSIRILDAATDKSAFRDMNRAKTRQWLAAKLDKRFTEKVRTEDETPLSTMSDNALREAFVMALKNDADKLAQMGVNLNFTPLQVMDADLEPPQP